MPTGVRRGWLCAHHWGSAGGRNLSQLRCPPLGSFRACDERPAVIRADDTGQSWERGLRRKREGGQGRTENHAELEG